MTARRAQGRTEAPRPRLSGIAPSPTVLVPPGYDLLADWPRCGSALDLDFSLTTLSTRRRRASDV